MFLFLSSNDSIRNSRNLPSIKYDKIILWLVLISNDTASSENRKYIFEGGWQTDTVATYFDRTICFNLSRGYELLMKRSIEMKHIIYLLPHCLLSKNILYFASIQYFVVWIIYVSSHLSLTRVTAAVGRKKCNLCCELSLVTWHGAAHHPAWICTVPRLDFSLENSASKSFIRRFVITEKAPTRAFFWLKAATTAFTFKTLLKDTMLNRCWPYGK